MGCSASVPTANTVVANPNNEQQGFQGNLSFGAPSGQSFQPQTQAAPAQQDSGNHPDFSRFKPASEMQVTYQPYQQETQVHYEQQKPPQIQQQQQPQVQQTQFQQQPQTQFQQQPQAQFQQQQQPQTFQPQPQVQQTQGQHQTQPFPPQHAQTVQQYQQHQQQYPQPQSQVQQQPQVQRQVQPFPPQRAENMQQYQQHLQQTKQTQNPQQNQIGQQNNQYGQQQNQQGYPNQQFVKPVEIIPPKDEAEQVRETINGVTYHIGVISHALKSVSIDATVAKAHIPDLETRIRKENKWLSAISITFNLNEPDLMDYFITDVFKTSTYTSFTIVFEHFMMFTPQALQNFGRVISSTNLEKLSLTHNGYDANDMSLAIVMPGLQRLTQTLKVLRLSFTSCIEMTDQSFVYIRDAIANNQVLQDFAVSFGNTTNISMQSLVHVQNALRNKPNLTRLQLSFMNMEHFNDGAFPIFTEIVRGLPRLEYLDISTLNAGYSPEGFSNFANFCRTLRLVKLTLLWKDEPNARHDY